MTSTVTLLELLVQPYRDQKEELAQKIFALTSSYPKLESVPVTMDVADRAAELRGSLSAEHARCNTIGYLHRPQGYPFLWQGSEPTAGEGH